MKPDDTVDKIPIALLDEDIDEESRYFMGPEPPYDPAQERYKHMLRLVAYDISDQKRLRKVAKICEDFGIRVEYSVFECDLGDDDFTRLWNSLLGTIDRKEDKIIVYWICSSCVRKTMSTGPVVRPAKPLAYIM